MNYDEAKGWLVGEANRGLAAMFTMMNAERLMVGIQGLGIAGAAISRRLPMRASVCRAAAPMAKPAGADHRPCRCAPDAAQRWQL
jgi:alkylation response protein AidB-like acyl-CoA dehydrogenase